MSPIDDPGAPGYRQVDDDPDVDMLIARMDETARWKATVRLRSWERRSLALTAGERLLDVGCGPGDAGIALARALGDTGELVGIDSSDQMLRVARARARPAACRVRFTRGDASSLEEPADGFDAVRCERTLQWLPDPAVAVAEMVRVLRPGGRISLIDTDWSTFDLSVGDDALAAVIREAMRTERNRPANVGSRLGELVVAAGCEPVAQLEATETWTSWNPDESAAPLGCFSMDSLVDDLVAAGRLPGDDRQLVLATIQDAARRGEFTMRLTMFGVVAISP